MSVVIPTWEEAPWLGRLLAGLRAWNADMEIIVADNYSTDDTRAVARSFRCETVIGGLPGLGRNRGAAAASAQYLLFVDADVVPTEAALDVVASEVAGAAADVVSFRHIPLSEDRSIRLFYGLADSWFRLASCTRSKQSLASFLLVRRACFERLGGFDVELEPGEDVEFVRRAGRTALVRHERRSAVFVSPRRFSTEPKYWFALKTAIWGLMRVAGIRATLLRYRWIHHDPLCADAEARLLRGRAFDDE